MRITSKRRGMITFQHSFQLDVFMYFILINEEYIEVVCIFSEPSFQGTEILLWYSFTFSMD